MKNGQRYDTLIIIIITSVFLVFMMYLIYPLAYSSILASFTLAALFYYAWETTKIKEANISLLQQNRIPTASVGLFINEKNEKDIYLKIQNMSKFPLTALINIQFLIDDVEQTNIHLAYSGGAYWNLGAGESMIGHFDRTPFYKNAPGWSKGMYEYLTTGGPGDSYAKDAEERGASSNMKFILGVYSRNEYGEYINYPPRTYKFKILPFRVIPSITDKEPYWKYNEKPGWVLAKESSI
ncbi:MAG: hypothetical protein HOD37_10585 [Bacteroidetes bacterium]|nr:hypothetical protein [Bacteroidota bacterium]